jgi:hypothetical protein
MDFVERLADEYGRQGMTEEGFVTLLSAIQRRESALGGELDSKARQQHIKRLLKIADYLAGDHGPAACRETQQELKREVDAALRWARGEE